MARSIRSHRRWTPSDSSYVKSIASPFLERPARAQEKAAPALKLPKGLEHFISGRNQLIGRVTKVEIVGLLAKVALDIGGQTITSIITSDACRDLGLKKGQARGSTDQGYRSHDHWPRLRDNLKNCVFAQNAKAGSSSRPPASPHPAALPAAFAVHGVTDWLLAFLLFTYEAVDISY